ncbi:MAG: M28 family peptidase, partial [bacterium]
MERQVAFGPRHPGTPGSEAIRDWMAAEVTRLGGRVERQTFVDTVGGSLQTVVNVIGRFGPESGRRIGLYAHYDTRPWSDMAADPTDRERPVPGANDAASGVAVLLEVAELMSRHAPPGLGTEATDHV